MTSLWYVTGVRGDPAGSTDRVCGGSNAAWYPTHRPGGHGPGCTHPRRRRGVLDHGWISGVAYLGWKTVYQTQVKQAINADGSSVSANPSRMSFRYSVSQPLERGKEGNMVAASGREATPSSVTRNAQGRDLCPGTLKLPAGSENGSVKMARAKRYAARFLAVLAIVFAMAATTAAAATLVVDGDGLGSPGNCDDLTTAAYLTITLAITAANPGDTVLVCPGTYPENPNITKSLTLESTGDRDGTTIQLPSPPTTTYLGSLQIEGADVTVGASPSKAVMPYVPRSQSATCS